MFVVALPRQAALDTPDMAPKVLRRECLVTVGQLFSVPQCSKDSPRGCKEKNMLFRALNHNSPGSRIFYDILLCYLAWYDDESSWFSCFICFIFSPSGTKTEII